MTLKIYLLLMTNVFCLLPMQIYSNKPFSDNTWAVRFIPIEHFLAYKTSASVYFYLTRNDFRTSLTP